MNVSMPARAPRWPLPQARGPISSALIRALLDAESDADPDPDPAPKLAKPEQEKQNLLYDEDFQLSLALLHELRFHGVEGVPDGVELRPDLHALRTQMDRLHLEAVFALVDTPTEIEEIESVTSYIKERCLPTHESAEESLGRRLSSQGTADEFREYFIHRSLYLLREADAHSYAIPWLETDAKFALLEIQFDEYGSGRRKDVHAQLFANTMASVGLSPDYGHYIDIIPAITLADLNMLSAFTTTRAHRGLLMGNLCALEGTSSLGSKAVSSRLRRLDFPEVTRRFYDVHVLADAVHEEVAVTDLAGRMAESDPGMARDLCLGVDAYFAMESLVGNWILSRWQQGESSLLGPR